MVMQEFDAIQDCESLPQLFVVFVEIAATGTKSLRTGGRIDYDRIFATFAPLPKIEESFVQRELISFAVTFGVEGHSTAGTRDVLRDLKTNVCALSNKDQRFRQR